ncbi:MAG: PaaI family thioesterase [Firmicutes bacterium]|nr:PaaI family thioesterase [Bacillota bacterium]
MEDKKLDSIMTAYKSMPWPERIEYIINSRRKLPQNEGRLNSMFEGKFVSANDEKKVFIVEYKIERWMENPRGELHGGALATLFDTVAGLGSISVAESPNVATIDLYINYLSRADGTDTVVMNARIVRAGKRFIRMTIDAFSKDKGHLIATATVNFAVLAPETVKPMNFELKEKDEK